MRIAFLEIIGILIATVSCAEESALENAVKEAAGHYGSHEPGVLISVSQGDVTLTEEIRGIANLETDAPLTCDTPMRIASLTKQFVAVAILQLAESNTINIDAPVSHYLPELGAAGDGVTIRHLLNHLSGLPHHSLLFMNLGRVPYDEEKNTFLFAPEGSRTDDFMPTNEDVISLLAEFPKKRFPPGTKWEYSNTGYIVLTQVVEAVSAMPFRDYAQKKLFDPLHMMNSGVLDETRRLPDDRARSFVTTDLDFEERDYSPFNLLHGDGGIYSSLCDLKKWRRAFSPGVLLSAASIAEIRKPARLADGTIVRKTLRSAGYGMGWFLDNIDGEPVLLHGGGWAAFRHAIYFAPEADIWVIVLSNRDDTQPYEMAEALMRAALKDDVSRR